MKVRRLNVLYRSSNSSLEAWQTHQKQTAATEELLDSYSLEVDAVAGLTNCDFCGQSFRKRLFERKGTWAYLNCIEVLVKEKSDGGKIVVHKSCFDVLQEDKQEAQ